MRGSRSSEANASGGLHAVYPCARPHREGIRDVTVFLCDVRSKFQFFSEDIFVVSLEKISMDENCLE